MIVISKNSRLYKTYNTLSKLAIFNLVTPTYAGETEAFRDVCTFFRTTLLYLFIAIPSWVFFILAIGNVIFQTTLSAITFDVQPATLVILVISGALGIVACMISTIAVGCTVADAITNKTSKSQFFTLIKESVASKHNKICKIIKVEDKKDD